MNFKNSFISMTTERRKLRRLIGHAMTGTALGVGLLTLPVLADTYAVTTTNDSGGGSLRQAIIDADTDGTSSIIDLSSLSPNAVFTLNSVLPSITNSSGVTFDFSDVNSITLLDAQGNPSALSVDEGGMVTVSGENGGTGGQDDDNGGNGGNSNITGGVTAKDATFNLLGSNGGEGGLGDDTGGNGGAGGAGGSSNITGNVTATNSNFNLMGGAGGAGGDSGSDGNGGEGGTGGDSFIQGNVTANGNSTFTLQSGNDGFEGAYNGGAGGVGGAGGNAYITGNVIANDNAAFNLYGQSYINGNATANGFGYFTLYDNSSITGNATANDNGIFYLTGQEVINGNVTANDEGLFYVYGQSDITGSATFNDASQFVTLGTPSIEQNLTFGSNAFFEPFLDMECPPDPSTLTVGGTLTPGNARIWPWWDTPQNTFTTGQEYTVLQYGTLDGEFNPAVISPVPFDISYDGNDVDLTISSTRPFDFDYVPGTGNERALGTYLNGFVTTGLGYGQAPEFTIHDTTNGAPLDLPELVENFGYYEVTLNELLPYTGDVFTSFGAQDYWNQMSFVNSIADELRDGNNEQGNAADFALNAGASNDVRGQLNSLQHLMDAPAYGLGFESGQGIPGGVWASVTQSRLNTDGNDAIGSPQWNSSSQSESVGYTSGGDSFRWGVAAGHQKNDLGFDNRDASGDMEGYNAGLYGSWNKKNTYLNAILGYSNFDNNLESDGTSSFTSHGLSAYLELGKHPGQNKPGGFTPYASLLWTRNNHDGTTADTDGGYGSPVLTLSSGSENTLTSQFGIRYNHHTTSDDGRLKGGWGAGLSWLHQFNDTGFPVTGTYGDPLVDGAPTSFTMDGTPLSSNAAQVELGAYGRIYRSLVGFVGYRGIFSSDQKQNSVTAGVGYQF